MRAVACVSAGSVFRIERGGSAGALASAVFWTAVGFAPGWVKNGARAAACAFAGAGFTAGAAALIGAGTEIGAAGSALGPSASTLLVARLYEAGRYRMDAAAGSGRLFTAASPSLWPRADVAGSSVFCSEATSFPATAACAECGNINDGVGWLGAFATMGTCGTTATSVPEPWSAGSSFLRSEFGTDAPSSCAPPSCPVSWNSVRLSKTFLNKVDLDAFPSFGSNDAARETSGTGRAEGADAETITAPTYAGSRPQRPLPVISALARCIRRELGDRRLRFGEESGTVRSPYRECGTKLYVFSARLFWLRTCNVGNRSWIRLALWRPRGCRLACNRSTLSRTTSPIHPPADIRAMANSTRSSLQKLPAKMLPAHPPFP